MTRRLTDGILRVPLCLALTLASACTDGPLSPARHAGADNAPSLLSAEYECQIDVRAKTMECGLSPLGKGRGGPQLDLLLFGAQARAVIKGGPTFSNGNSANPDTLTYSLAVLNLLPQPIGTTDGVTAAPGGTRLVITGYVQSNANATLDNADGTATFVDSVSTGTPATFPNKQYISYPGVLAPNDTSQAKTLRFVYSPAVTTLSFKYRISAPVQYEYGFVSISPPAPVIGAGQTLALTYTVFTGFGQPLGESVTWSSSNSAVATVNATGVVTALAGGTATITATSVVDSRRTGTRVLKVIQANGDTFGEIVSGPINTANTIPAFSVAANDSLDPSATITFAGWNGLAEKSQQGGDVVMTASGAGMGRFTYTPPAGFQGVDSVAYTIQVGSAQSTAKVALVVDRAPAVTGTTPGTGGTLNAADNIVIAFSEPVNVSAASFSVQCPTGYAQGFTISGSGTGTITVNPAGSLPAATTCTVTVIASQVSDADWNDGPNLMVADYVFSVYVT